MVKKAKVKSTIKKVAKKPRVRRRYGATGKFEANGMKCVFDGYHGSKTAKVDFSCDTEGAMLQVGDEDHCMIPHGTIKVPAGKITIPKGKSNNEEKLVNPIIGGERCYITEFSGKLTIDIPDIPSQLSKSVQIEVEDFLESIDAKSI